MTSIWFKPLAMRIAAFAAMAEQADRRRVKRKLLSAARQKYLKAFNEKHGITGPSSRLPRKVLKALHRTPTRKRKVSMPALKFTEGGES
jgi:hypothetical protein